MNLLQKCVCILLLAVSLGAKADSACTASEYMAKVKDCTKNLDGLTPAEKKKIDTQCTAGVESVDCIVKVNEECDVPSVIAQIVETGNDFNKAVCVLHKTPNPLYSNCSVDDIFQCNEPLSGLSESEQANLKIMCPKMTTAFACVKNEIIPCPQDVKDKYKKYYASTKPSRDRCGSGEALKSNLGVLSAVAAMVLGLRHFL